MPPEDWQRFARKTSPNSATIDGLHFGGLIVAKAIESDTIYPLLFHEVGHTLYPSTLDSFTDELRAYYFQILCTHIFETQLQRLDISVSYPPIINNMFPTAIHSDAYSNAQNLYDFNRLPLLQIPDNSSYYHRMRQLSALL